MNAINFYSANAEYGCFSNFSVHPIEQPISFTSILWYDCFIVYSDIVDL